MAEQPFTITDDDVMTLEDVANMLRGMSLDQMNIGDEQRRILREQAEAIDTITHRLTDDAPEAP